MSYAERLLAALQAGSAVARDHLVLRGDGQLRARRGGPVLRVVREVPSRQTASVELFLRRRWVDLGVRGTPTTASRELLGALRRAWEPACARDLPPTFDPAAAHFMSCAGAAGNLQMSGITDRAVHTGDHLTEGPCRFDDDPRLAEWLERRMRWWAERHHHPHVPGRAAQLAEQIEEDGRPAILWAGTVLDEQLATCWFAEVLPRGVPLWRALPPRPTTWPVFPLGELLPAHLWAAQPLVVDRDERERLAALWRAFAAPDPTEFLALAEADRRHPATDALHTWIARFPDRRTGVSAWEHRLLAHIEACAGAPFAEVCGALIAGEEGREPDAPGWWSLLWSVEELARGGLVAEDLPRDAYPGRRRFRLTDLGRDVLAGRANRVDVAGFDRWLGGAHLQAEGTMWWRDGAAVVRG